jgi:hypothetical protein
MEKSMSTNTELNVNFDQEAAAAYLSVSVQWLEDQRQKGFGPPFAKLGRKIVYRKGDLDAFVQQRIVGSTAEAKQLQHRQ